MEKKVVVQLQGLVTGYRGKREDIRVSDMMDAVIQGGELTCLLGSNGAGKSTLLRTLAAFQPPLAGAIRLFGKSLHDYSDKELAKRIGVVLTERFDEGNLTVDELVGLGRSPYTGFWGTLRKEDKEVVAEALKQVGIEGLSGRVIHTLSDGERQKVMIAKALAQQTPVILLDEPTAFLDFPSKVEIMQLLHSLAHAQGKTIFLSTHDLELALQLADKLWLMDKEKGLVIGTPEDLSLNGSLEQFFCRKGIVFDRQSGLFRIDAGCDKELRVVGEGYRYDMVCKALRRYGIRGSRQAGSPVYVRVGESDKDKFVWHRETGDPVSCDTIEDLLDCVLESFRTA